MSDPILKSLGRSPYFVIPSGLFTRVASFLTYLYFLSTTHNLAYAQLTLTYALIGCGALLIMSTEPPLNAFALANEYRGNRWPALVELLFVLIFFALITTELGKELFDIELLGNLLDYLFIAATVIW